MLNVLSSSHRLKSIVDLAKNDSILLEKLWSCPKALYLSLLKKELKKSILVVYAAKDEALAQDLAFFAKDVVEFPAWETLPGEEIAPSIDIVGKRWETLSKLVSSKTPHVVLCPLQALLQKVVSPTDFSPLCERWKIGDTISFQSIPSHLSEKGYTKVSVVSDKGQFAVRGGIIDLYPSSSKSPFRVDFFGDEIDQIKAFDPISQKSIEKVDKLLITPASEKDRLHPAVQKSSILDFLGEEKIVVFDDLLAIEDKYVSIQTLPGANGPFFFSLPEIFKALSASTKVYFTETEIEKLHEDEKQKRPGRAFYSGKEASVEVSFEICDLALTAKKASHPFIEISDYFSPYENTQASGSEEIAHGIARMQESSLNLFLFYSSESEKKVLSEQLSKTPKNTKYVEGYLSSGFVLPEENFALLPYSEFTQRYKIKREQWRTSTHTPPSDFHELSSGDLVVHFQHGIGKYIGVEKKTNHLGTESEFLVIEYSEGSKFYTPIAQSHLISRYIGAREEVPTLDTIGSTKWQRTRLQAQKAIVGYAQELLTLQANRSIQGGFTFLPDGEKMRLFEEDFPFVETEDQILAIEAIKSDMTSNKAMDRIVCGDVGYGKTEVAMRAAFKAVVDGKKQVAVLVPTTLLALQHCETFQLRMANFKLRIESLTRAKTAKETKEILNKLALGEIDILVGTHRLLSQDVVFHDLGLMIVDEEQRFGVKAKEHLKKAKVGVDCLTLSATPIPRTLYLSLVGGKDISIIHTPPHDRLPIKSILSEKDSGLIQNAFLRELSRDGQGYFIHNRVETIFQVSEELKKLLPQARILTAHGQMDPSELDTIFHSFKSGLADILVATTLVENGIDIPNANTIIIDQSHTFGMADLYQLRGRVGRWNRPAFAYFLIPKHRSLPEITRKRLHALIETSGYGGGMKIAMRDLEIRGAGDILGIKQSGQISDIGFHLYCKLLKRTIDALKNKTALDFFETKMEFSIDARFPEEYIGEPNLRLEMYHRLGETTTFAQIEEFYNELMDRFGKPPLPTEWLYHLSRIRIFASQHRYSLIKFQSFSWIAEKMKGKKEKVQKTFALPKTQKPEVFEKEVLSILQKSF